MTKKEKLKYATIEKIMAGEKKINVRFSSGIKMFITDENSQMNAFKKEFLKIKE